MKLEKKIIVITDNCLILVGEIAMIRPSELAMS